MNSELQKSIETLRAQFALQGHTLAVNYRNEDLHPTYWVSRWGQARSFSSLHDVCAFLAQIGGTLDEAKRVDRPANAI